MEREYIRGAAIHASATMGPFNKTGSWRLQEPVVDQSKCIACKICSQFCPDECIERLVARVPDDPSVARIKIDMEYCKGCGICARECPKGAITMVGG